MNLQPNFTRYLKLLPIALMLALFNITTASTEDRPSRYALLIAVTRYQHQAMDESKLVYPEIDAKAVGRFLSDHGYTVEYLLGKEATKSAIEAKLNVLATKGDTDGAVLLGLWGHGVEFEDKQETMFCPYDASVRPQLDADKKQLYDTTGNPQLEPDPKTLVGTSRLLLGLKISGGGSRILLADCCRNSPNKARGRAFGSEVSVSNLPNNTAALFACQANEQAFEDDAWGHGAMTRGLLDLLPGIAENEFDDIGSFAFPLKRKVASLVASRNQGKAGQTVTPIIKGTPELRLSKDQYGSFDGWKGGYTQLVRAGGEGEIRLYWEGTKATTTFNGKTETVEWSFLASDSGAEGQPSFQAIKASDLKLGEFRSDVAPEKTEEIRWKHHKPNACFRAKIRIPDHLSPGTYSVTVNCKYTLDRGAAWAPRKMTFKAEFKVGEKQSNLLAPVSFTQ